ncbi:MAG: thermonuclease family protein [Alphaproteobacteria bacterium]|nr:thermonuclease family protein [Alphaproteobacteria bacterium]HPF45712.1 thermonuclease family protein [Emcibacteraceae bacterium]HRW28774.1 thermonuclease family protein [Emcibacteraceae bacterium]
MILVRTFFLIIICIIGFVNYCFAYDTALIKQKLTHEKQENYYRVIEIIDGDTLRLENNIEVRLVGLQAPKIALGRKNFNPWPLGNEAKDTLAALALNKNVTLLYGGRKMDRYGRALAHLFLEDGTWIQGEMVKRGMARVYSFADNRSVVEELLEEEKIARHTGTGIWGLNFYKIKTDLESGKYTNSFQLISGKILEVATVRNNTYLNFGEDYKTDFTIVVPSRVNKMFEKKDIKLSDLEGRNIIVRGWLKYYNGPSLDLTHPEQLIIE